MSWDYDTTEAGGGSYPEPPKSKNKCYEFEVYVLSKKTGYVWAESKEDAVDLIYGKEWDELDDETIIEVGDVVDIHEY